MNEYVLQGGPLDGKKMSLPGPAFDITIRYMPDDESDETTIDLARLDQDYYRFSDSDESQPVLTWTPSGVWMAEGE